MIRTEPQTFNGKDIAGVAFGKLTAVEPVGKVKRGYLWKCLCACGNESVVLAANLLSGNTKTCGCGKSENMTRLNVSRTTHGQSTNNITPTYRAWIAMKCRCHNVKGRDYERYGGRGISVCHDWLDSFETFAFDMGERPSALHSLDRIDNDGNYEPGNCRWATNETQTNNRRVTRKIEFLGISQTLSEWSRQLDLNVNTLWFRLRNGWSVEDMLSKLARTR